MFRRTKKLVRIHRERLLSLVLLPAFFLGTFPHTACICADGHREEFCQATTCHFRGQHSATNSCSGCSCCRDHSKGEPRSCCQAKHGRCAPSNREPAAGLMAKTGSCCHPFVEAPNPVVVAAKSDLTAKSISAFQIVAVPVLWLAQDVRPTFERVQDSTPPPLDAVIVFQRLTI